MKTMEQTLQQDAAENLIEPLSTAEINAVSGGAGQNRMLIPSLRNASSAPRGTAIPDGKTYSW